MLDEEKWKIMDFVVGERISTVPWLSHVSVFDCV